MQKKLFNKVWIYYGRTSGISLGFSIDKHHWTIDLVFWYIGQEF